LIIKFIIGIKHKFAKNNKMKLFALLLIMALTTVACQKTQKSNASEQKQKAGAWLPSPEYQPIDSRAKMLSDSAAFLQVRANQDPTLDELQRIKMIEEAFFMLNEALKIDPNYGLAMSNLSAIYLERKDTSKALELMRRRLSVEPNLAEGWQAVGVFTDLSGDSIEAKKCYQKSLDIYDSRLKMGKQYSIPEDLIYYYDNWSGKAFSLLISGDTENAHNSIRAMLEEAAPILGQNTDTYAAMLSKDRWVLLKEMSGK
jgi:tetratricopeptide (TPR) repeat protein